MNIPPTLILSDCQSIALDELCMSIDYTIDERYDYYNADFSIICPIMKQTLTYNPVRKKHVDLVDMAYMNADFVSLKCKEIEELWNWYVRDVTFEYDVDSLNLRGKLWTKQPK